MSDTRINGLNIGDSRYDKLSGEYLLQNSISPDKIKDGVKVIEFEASIEDNKGVSFAIMNEGKGGKSYVLKAFSARLTEVPDSSATTMTVMVEDGSGNDALSSALTFTEGTDAAGTVLDGAAVTTANRVFTDTESINCLIGGTSVVKGKVKCTAQFLVV